MSTSLALSFEHLRDLAVREGSINSVVRAAAAVANYEDQLAALNLVVPFLPTTDVELGDVRGLVADAMVALAQLDQVIGLGVEKELVRRFEEDPAMAAKCSAEERAA